jgi:hypothetical protein
MPDASTLPAESDALEEKPKRKYDRDTDLAHLPGKKGKDLRKQLLKDYAEIEEGFIKQAQRSDDQLDWWDAYNCTLGGYQAYSGNAQIFVPIIHNAVNARATRFVNQLFPKGGRYVEAVSSDKEEPNAIVALLEHYVRKAKLRTEVAPALCVSGDVEGQYNLYVSWSTLARHATWKEKKPIAVDGAAILGVGDEVEDIVEDVILDEHAVVEVLPDADVLILPITSNSVPEALARGGSVTIIRRWTKTELDAMVEAGDIDEDEADALLTEMKNSQKQGQTDVAKQHADAAGIKMKGKVALGYETWKVQDLGDEKRLCVTKYGSDKIILSCKLNPYWSDRCPLISVPVKKVPGIAKGQSQVEPCCKMQYAANDAVNEGMDSATYSLLPIIMTDPLKNPKTNTMILDLAAVWETSPNDTKFATFPQLYKEAFEIVAACQTQIFQTLSVSPSMLPQQTGSRGGKRNQAEVALEQQVDILSTADAVTVLEEGVFTEVLMRFAEMDAQFRSDDVTVRAFGHMGMRASMETVEPLQLGTRYNFVWYGVEQARDAAARQQQIALLNVARGIPPQLLPGRKLNMVPALDAAFASVFGSRIAPYIFEDVSKQMTYPADQENMILEEGHLWPVSPMDDDAKHIEEHMQAVQQTGDPHGSIKQHIAWHRMAQIQKALAQQQQGQPGTPGQPGIAGQPRPGGQVANPRQSKGPAGMISQDQMPRMGAVVPPRRA